VRETPPRAAASRSHNLKTCKDKDNRCVRPVIALLVLSVGTAVLLLVWGSEKGGRPPRPPVSHGSVERVSDEASPLSDHVREDRPAVGGADSHAPQVAEPDGLVSDDTPAPARPSAAMRRERSVAAWEGRIEWLAAAATGIPSAAAVSDITGAFAALDEEDRTDGIRYAINLLPDEQFPVLYGILLDRRQSPEILDALFSDALNRPEAIKNRVMREVVKDERHPLFFESARILDVVTEAE